MYSQDNYDKNSNNLIKKPKKIKSDDNFILIWTLAAIFISVLISFGILFATNVDSTKELLTEKFGDVVDGIKNNTVLPPMLGGKRNILILGVDSNGSDSPDHFKNTRSDTMIILSIDPFAKTANAISIPRDSKVYIAEKNNGIDKINAAHAFGGPKLAVKTVENTLGVRINKYIAIDYQGIKELVDAIDGVPLYVEKRMRYRDNAGGLNIDLYPGSQTLNAEQAEGFLRFRHDPIADIGRMKRQRMFIAAMVKKLQSPEIIVKIPQLIQVASKYIRTDMNFYELSQLASYSKSLNLENVQTATLPGGPSSYGRVSYWILDPEKTQQVIDRLIYGDDGVKKEIPLTVGILYSASLEDYLPEIKSKLEKSGFNVSCKTKTKEVNSQILAHTDYAGFKAAKRIKNIIPELKDAQFIVSPGSNVCGDTDFTLILGK